MVSFNGRFCEDDQSPVDLESLRRYFRENPDAEAGRRALSSAECERAGFDNGGYVVALREPGGRIAFGIIEGEMPDIDDDEDDVN